MVKTDAHQIPPAAWFTVSYALYEANIRVLPSQGPWFKRPSGRSHSAGLAVEEEESLGLILFEPFILVGDGDSCAPGFPERISTLQRLQLTSVSH